MVGTKTLATLGPVLLLMAAAFLPATSQAMDFSRLHRNPDVLHGTIEKISPSSHTMVLLTQDGTRQTIHYSAETLVFNSATGKAAQVVPGLEALVRCRREVTTTIEASAELCPVRLFADSVYLASY